MLMRDDGGAGWVVYGRGEIPQGRTVHHFMVFVILVTAYQRVHVYVPKKTNTFSSLITPTFELELNHGDAKT